jgi:hypothetical protein
MRKRARCVVEDPRHPACRNKPPSGYLRRAPGAPGVIPDKREAVRPGRDDVGQQCPQPVAGDAAGTRQLVTRPFNQVQE